nr:hypothetical protein [Tanacetum cinerariifolium]
MRIRSPDRLLGFPSGFPLEMDCTNGSVSSGQIHACCDDDDDYNSAITPNEPVDSLSMKDEHLNTILATKSDEFIKSCVENLVRNPSESEGENGCDVPACFTTFSNILFDATILATKSDEFIKSCVENLVRNPSESEGENGCDVPACFTTFSNILFDADYEFESSNDQSCSDEDIPEKIFSNPLFDEEIIPMKIDRHHFNAESDLIESLLNHDSSIILSSSKTDSLLNEFAGELTLLKSITPRIDKTDCDPEEDIRLIERLLYDNSSPRPLE